MVKCFKIVLWIVAFLACLGGQASISKVEVSGEKGADVVFRSSGKEMVLPTISLKDNVIDLSFRGTDLADESGDKVDLSSPHVLVHRVSLFQPAKGLVKAQIVVNGTTEALSERVRLDKTDDGVRVSIALPAGENPTLKLLSEEQLPVNSTVAAQKAIASSSRWGEMAVMSVVVLFLLIGGFATFKFLKSRGRLGGSRKYLIEQLSYCSVGPNGKAGVCLLKIGKDFFLVGVTGNQVTMLSALPKLAEQYEEESRFERNTFNEAVEQEYKRLNGNRATLAA